MIQQSLELQLLNFLKRRAVRRIGLPHGAMAGVHKGKGVPTAVGNEKGDEIGFAAEFLGIRGRKIADGNGQRRKTGMIADPSKPILGVAVVRLSAMHDAVKKTSVGRLDALRDFVGTVQIVVPQQGGRLKKRPGILFQSVGFAEGVGKFQEFAAAFDAGTGIRPQRGKSFGSNYFPKGLGQRRKDRHFSFASGYWEGVPQRSMLFGFLVLNFLDVGVASKFCDIVV